MIWPEEVAQQVHNIKAGKPLRDMALVNEVMAVLTPAISELLPLATVRLRERGRTSGPTIGFEPLDLNRTP